MLSGGPTNFCEAVPNSQIQLPLKIWPALKLPKTELSPSHQRCINRNTDLRVDSPVRYSQRYPTHWLGDITPYHHLWGLRSALLCVKSALPINLLWEIRSGNQIWSVSHIRENGIGGRSVLPAAATIEPFSRLVVGGDKENHSGFISSLLKKRK